MRSCSSRMTRQQSEITKLATFLIPPRPTLVTYFHHIVFILILIVEHSDFAHTHFTTYSSTARRSYRRKETHNGINDFPNPLAFQQA